MGLKRHQRECGNLFEVVFLNQRPLFFNWKPRIGVQPPVVTRVVHNCGYVVVVFLFLSFSWPKIVKVTMRLINGIVAVVVVVTCVGL